MRDFLEIIIDLLPNSFLSSYEQSVIFNVIPIEFFEMLNAFFPVQEILYFLQLLIACLIPYHSVRFITKFFRPSRGS